jgi:hypothetical protein
VFPESSVVIGHSCVLTQNSEDQGGSMIPFALGVLITVIVLAGFGFVATASNGWFFKYRKPHDPLPGDKNN